MSSPAPPPDPEQPTEPSEALTATSSEDHAWLKTVLLYSVMAGVCPLSPIPFIDDLVISYIRKRMIRAIFDSHGITLNGQQVKALTERKMSFIFGCCMAVVVYPVKKIFRKVFYFFAVKDCVDVTSDFLHQGILYEYALTAGHIDAEAFSGTSTEAADRINAAMTIALKEADTSPINQLLKRTYAGSRVLIQQAASGVARLIRKKGGNRKNREAVEEAIEDAELVENEEIKGVVDQLTEAVWSKEGYLTDLYARFERALRQVDEKGALEPEA